MDQIKELLFEKPWPAVVGLLIVAIPLAYLAWRGGGGRKRLLPAVPLALAGLLLLTDALVQTDREKIQKLFDQARKATLANKPDEVALALTGQFQLQMAGRTCFTGRDETLALLRGTASYYPLQSIDFTELNISVDSDSAVADMTARTQAASGRMSGGYLLLKWRVRLARRPDGRWLFDCADLREINGHSTEGLTFTPELKGWF